MGIVSVLDPAIFTDDPVGQTMSIYSEDFEIVDIYTITVKVYLTDYSTAISSPITAFTLDLKDYCSSENGLSVDGTSSGVPHDYFFDGTTIDIGPLPFVVGGVVDLTLCPIQLYECLVYDDSGVASSCTQDDNESTYSTFNSATGFLSLVSSDADNLLYTSERDYSVEIRAFVGNLATGALPYPI